VDALLTGLEREKHPLARVGYLYGLVLLGRKENLEALRDMLKLDDAAVRRNVLNSFLYGYDEDLPAGNERIEWIAALRNLLSQEDNPAVRSEAEELLERLCNTAQ